MTTRRRRYDSPVRRRRVEQTRRSIIEAAAELLRTRRPDQLSMAAVAQAAGVGVRTVYRHFGNARELIRAVAASALSELAGANTLPETRAAAADRLAEIHRRLSREPSLYRLFFEVPLRSGIGLGPSVERWTDDVRRQLPAELDRPARAAFELFLSPYAWEVMHTHYGLPPEQITRLCLAGAQALMDALAHHPEWLRDDGPLPPLFRSERAERGGTEPAGHR